MSARLNFVKLSVTNPELCFLFSETDKGKKEEVDVKIRKQNEEEKYIVCKACRNEITLPSHQIKAQGSFQHTFLNPAGQIFVVGCFRKTYGCVAIGPLSEEWSWFKDFSWQIALCSKCMAHLGWRYIHTSKESFFGLILDALI